MRIGIDVSALCKPWDGIGTYIWDMISYLSQVQGTDEFYLYSNMPTIKELPSSASFHLRQGRDTSHLRWLFLTLPGLMRADVIDVFWQPNCILPYRVGSVKNVVTVYDISAYAYTEFAEPAVILIHNSS